MFLVRHFSTSWGSLPRRCCLASLPSVQAINSTLRYYSSETPSGKLDHFRNNTRHSLRVTEFITQYDEISQIKETGILRPATIAMEEGSRVHGVLECNMATQKLSEMLGAELWKDLSSTISKTSGNSEIEMIEMGRDFIRLLESTTKLLALARGTVDKPEGAIREVYLRAMLPGDSHKRFVRGIVDGMYLGPGGIVITETKTTRQVEISAVAIRLAYHQALTYYWMMDKLLSAGNTLEYLVSTFGLTIDIAHLIMENKWLATNVNDAILQLKVHGLAPDIRLEFLKQRRRGVYEVEVFEIPFDREVCEAVIQARLDLLDEKRQPYIFRQCDVPQEVHIIDEPLNWENLTESEYHGLNLHVSDQIR